MIPEKPPLNEAYLAHFGVKGMRWGVRKSDPHDSTESQGLRSESARNANEFSTRAIEKRYSTTRMSEDEYATLSRGKEFIEKGDLLLRTTKNPATVLAGQTFVSRTLGDAKVYNAILAGGAGKITYTPTYELEARAVKKLAGPSEKERVDIFVDVLSKPSIRLPHTGETMTGKAYLEKYYAPEIREMSAKQAGLEMYRKFTWLNYETDNPLTQAYTNTVRSKGYDFMTDDNNKGYLTQKPAILLKADSSMQVTKVRRLTSDEINQAQRELVAPTR